MVTLNIPYGSVVPMMVGIPAIQIDEIGVVWRDKLCKAT
jgi:hypothetical protein